MASEFYDYQIRAIFEEQNVPDNLAKIFQNGEMHYSTMCSGGLTDTKVLRKAVKVARDVVTAVGRKAPFYLQIWKSGYLYWATDRIEMSDFTTENRTTEDGQEDEQVVDGITFYPQLEN